MLLAAPLSSAAASVAPNEDWPARPRLLAVPVIATVEDHPYLSQVKSDDE